MSTCGDCEFWNEAATEEPGVGMCCGAPPSVIMAPITQARTSRIVMSPNGQPGPTQMGFMPARPSMPRDAPGCALFREQVAVQEEP